MNEQLNDGGPAFPTKLGAGEGMTLRDYLAAKAMHALLVDPVFTREVQAKRKPVGETVALTAYGMADAMLAARALPQGVPNAN